ncbi:hypothetical protein ISS09_04170, partial [Candidatus Woesearchaeota archaeon]|nr:hypothetical protein [Candidatus Woesearchaeota archaeon]
LRAGLIYDDTTLVTEGESVGLQTTSGIPTGKPITVKRFNLLKDLSKAYAANDDLGGALAMNQLLFRELSYELLENHNKRQEKGMTTIEIPTSNAVDVQEFTNYKPFKKQEVAKEDELLVDKEKQLKFLWNQAQEEKARLADIGFNKLYLQLVSQREKIEESSKLREGTLESEFGDMGRYSLSEKSAGIVFYVLTNPFKGGYTHDIVNVAGGFKEVKEKIKVLDEENQENVRGLVAIQSLVGMGVRSNTIEAWLNDELEDETVEDMVKLLIVMSGHGTPNPESSPEFSNSMAGMAGSIINVNGEDYGVKNDKYNLVFGFLEENKESAKKVYGSDFKFDLEALTGKTIFAYEPGAYSTKYSVDIGGLQRAMFKGEVARVQLKDSEKILRFVDEGLSPGAILLGAATGGFGGTFFSSATGGWGAVLGVAENFVIDTGAGGFMVMNNYDPEEHPFMAMGASVGTGLSTTTVFRLAKGFFKNAFKPAAGLLTEVSDDALHGLGLIRRGDVIYEREYGSKIASANDLKKHLQKVSADSKTAKEFSEELFPNHKPSFDESPELPKPRKDLSKTTISVSTRNMNADFLEAHNILKSKPEGFEFYVHGTNGKSLDSILDMGGDLLPGKVVKERGGLMFTGESGGTTGMNSQRVSVVTFDHQKSLRTTQDYAEGAAKPYDGKSMDGFSIRPSNVDERIEVLEGYLKEYNIKEIPDHAPIMKELKAAEVRIPQLKEMKKVFAKMSKAEIAEYNRLSDIPVVVLGKQMHSEIGQVVSDIPGEVSVPSMRVDIIATPKQHVDEVRSMVRQKGGSAKVVSFEELERLKKGDIIPDIAKRIDEPTTKMYSDDYFDAMKGEDVNDFRLIEKARSALNKQLIDKNTNAVRVSYIQSSFDDWYTGNFNPKTGKIRLYMYYFNKESMPEGILKGNADILPKGYTKYQTKELADKAIARGDEDMAILLSPHETQISDIDGYYQYRATIELNPDEARRMGGGFNEYDEWIGGELPDKTLELKWKTIGPIKKESIVQVDEVKWVDGDFKIDGVEAWHAPDFNHKYVRWVDDLTKEFPPGIEVKVVRTNGQLDVGEVLGPVGENYVRVLVDLNTAYKDIHVDALRAWNKDLLDSRAIAATAESTSLFLRSLNPAKMSVREEEAVYNLFKTGKVSLGDAAPYLKKSIAGKELHDLNEIEILVKLQLGEISKVQADAFIGHAIKRELVDFVSEKNSYLGSLIKKNYHPVQDGALEGVDFYHGMTIDDYHKQVEWGGSYYSDTGKINLNTHSNSAIESRVRVVFHEIAHKLDLRSTAGWFTELRAYNFAYLTAKKLGIKGYLSNLDILANKVVRGKATPEEFIKALEKSGYENPASRRYVNTARLNFLKNEHPEMANRFIQRHRDIITITPPASP